MTTLAGSLNSLEIEKHHVPKVCSTVAEKGDTVHVHYIGSLMDTGKVFDSSYNRGEPIAFQLGVGQVIEGWDKGLLGVCKGENLTISIPSKMAYGVRGVPPVIPGDADLVFQCEVVSIDKNEPVYQEL